MLGPLLQQTCFSQVLLLLLLTPLVSAPGISRSSNGSHFCVLVRLNMRIISCSLELLIDVVDATLRCGHFPFFHFIWPAAKLFIFFSLQEFRNRLLNASGSWMGSELVRIFARWTVGRTLLLARATTCRARQGGTRRTFLRAAGRAAAASKPAKSTASTRWREVGAIRCPSAPTSARSHRLVPSNFATWSTARSSGRRANGAR